MTYSCCILEPKDYDSWNAFVAKCPGGGIYSDTRYLEVLSDVTNSDFRVLSVKEDGVIVAGIALFEQMTSSGPAIHPRLLMQYNGLVLRQNPSTYPSRMTSELIGSTDAIANFIEKQRYARSIIKVRWPFEDARVFLARGWYVTPTYTYIIRLSDLAGQWKKVSRNLRRLIKKCEISGIEVTRDDDFDSFYRMHVETAERKGAPIYLDEPQFRSYFRQLSEKGLVRLYHARIDGGQSIASQLVLAGDHANTETVSACADSQHLASGANAFLRWKVFEDLAADEYTFNDLTDATLNSVTRFKSQFGGDLRMCLTLQYRDSTSYRIRSKLARVLKRLSWRQK